MMRVLKVPSFNRWMRKVGLGDEALTHVVTEMKMGLIDADLGCGLVKKRVALPGRGKSGGARTLLATNRKGRWIFLVGFKKNEKANVSTRELGALQELSSDLLRLTERDLERAIAEHELLEVIYEKEK